MGEREVAFISLLVQSPHIKTGEALTIRKDIDSYQVIQRIQYIELSIVLLLFYPQE